MGFSLEDWINRQISGIEKHPLQSGLEAAGIGAAVALPFLAPEIGAGLGLGDLGVVAADEAAPVAADLGAGAAEAAPVAADLGAGAAEAAPVVADTGALGAGAAGALDAAGSGAADFAALDAGLGTPVGADVSNALAFAPTASAAPTPATDAVASLAAGNTPAAPAAVSGDLVTPTTEIASGSPQLNAAIGADTTGAAAAPETTKAAIAASNPGIQNLAGSQMFGAAPTAAAPAAAAPAAPSLTADVGAALNSPWTKAAELALPLGFLGYNLAKGPPPVPPQAQQAVNNATTQAAALSPQATANVPLFNQTAATDLTEATNFQISPAQAAQLSKYVSDRTNERYQFYASHGVTDPNQDSNFLSDVAQIKQDALAQQTQMINQLITTAFQSATAANAGLGTASNINSSANNALLQAAQLQMQGDQQYNQAVGDALKSFGLLAAVSSQGGKASPVQTAAVTNAVG